MNNSFSNQEGFPGNPLFSGGSAVPNQQTQMNYQNTLVEQSYIENILRLNRGKVVEVYVELDATLSLGEFIRQLRRMDLEIHNVQMEQESSMDSGTRGMLATLRSPKRCNHLVLIDRIKKIKGVTYLEEL